MKQPTSVAIVTEYINAMGGSDRVINSLLKIYPEAEIYAATFEKSQYPNLRNDVHTSFLQHPFFRKLFARNISVLTPYAFEQFDLRKHDLVISVSAGPSKGVVSTVEQNHIGIICTPPRHQWDGDINVRGSIWRNIYILGSKFISTYIRVWDITAMKRVDHVVSISKFIRNKVLKIYGRKSQVIYPGILDSWFDSVSDKEKWDVKTKHELPDRFLCVLSRLYDYKRIDWAIKACIETNNRLVVIGKGPDERFLKNLAAGHKNIRFIDYIPDSEMRAVYSLANAFPFCGVEDYGLVVVEAMACGLPVLGFNKGGVAETVINGSTGWLFDSYEELVEILKSRKWERIDKKQCIIRAKQLTESQFIDHFKRFVDSI